MKKPLLILLLSAGLAASCIYPFEAQFGNETKDALVIEGDILVGGYTQVSISGLNSLTGEVAVATENVSSIEVEDENGAIVKGIADVSSESQNVTLFNINTRECDPALKHRLLVKTDKNEYASEWLEVHIAPVIDSVSVNPDFDKKKMFIGLSCHSDSEQYFRWNYSETWEYHSRYTAQLKYEFPVIDTPTWNNGNGIITPITPEEQTHICWGADESYEVMLFNTEHQADNRFVDLDFLSINQDSEKLMSLYSINISVISLAEESYRYWETLNSTSSQSGDLFAPIPSEQKGNIECLSDNERLVIGYISASTVSSLRRFINNVDTQFYRAKTVTYEENQVFPEEQWRNKYISGKWRPYMETMNDAGQNVIEWAETRCVDCRTKGGTTVKPSFWPY